MKEKAKTGHIMDSDFVLDISFLKERRGIQMKDSLTPADLFHGDEEKAN